MSKSNDYNVNRMASGSLWFNFIQSSVHILSPEVDPISHLHRPSNKTDTLINIDAPSTLKTDAKYRQR